MTPFLGRTEFCIKFGNMVSKFGNMVIFRPGNLYSLCSPGNQYYQKIINFFFIKKVEIDNTKVVFLLELFAIINDSWYNQVYIFLILILTLIADFESFWWKKFKINKSFCDNASFLEKNLDQIYGTKVGPS